MKAPVSVDGMLKQACRVAAGLVLLGLVALVVDVPVSVAGRGLVARTPWGYAFWEWAELFGDGIGVALYSLVIFMAFRVARPYLPRVLICAFGSGLLADLIKAMVVRYRPRAFELGDSAFQSFLGFRPWLVARDSSLAWDSATQSFPSAHTATAFGFAVGLGWLFPRSRKPLLVLASLVACQRVVVGAHFPSDVLVGAAVGWVFAAFCIDREGLGRRMDAWETRLRAGQGKRDRVSESATGLVECVGRNNDAHVTPTVASVRPDLKGRTPAERPRARTA